MEGSTVVTIRETTEELTLQALSKSRSRCSDQNKSSYSLLLPTVHLQRLLSESRTKIPYALVLPPTS